jgi:hypothetical protein
MGIGEEDEDGEGMGRRNRRGWVSVRRTAAPLARNTVCSYSGALPRAKAIGSEFGDGDLVPKAYHFVEEKIVFYQEHLAAH